MPMECQWSGRVVARVAGKAVAAVYGRSKNPKLQLDPNTLRKGTGPLSFCPKVPRASDYPPLLHTLEQMDGSNSVVLIEVFLFSSNENQPPLSVSLTRDFEERAEKCFNRLGISIAKKLKRGSNKRKKDKEYGQNEATCTPFVHGDPSGEMETSQLNNGEFWSLAWSKPLSIQVSLPDANILLHVECNPPTIVSVSTFEKFESHIFPHIPVLLHADTMFASNAVVDWYVDGEIVCRDSPAYTPTEEDAGKTLSVMVSPVRPDHNGEGCQEAYQFQHKVSDSLPLNRVLQVRPTWQQPRVQSSSDLRVLSYNILADQNAFSGPERKPFFPWVSADVLVRSRRMQLILHEILAYNADVVCLQEVDQLVYDTLLQPVLEHCNFQGFYSVKQTAGNQEGCAMFWSLDKFQKADSDACKTFGLGQLLSAYQTSLNDDPEWGMCVQPVSDLFRNRPDVLDTITTKLGHVAQIADLKDLDGNPLLVANTHLFFHPIGSHIRALQLFAMAHQLSIEQGPMKKPFIVCGDFNTSLENAARLLMKRHIPQNFRSYRECLNSYCWEMNEAREVQSEYDDDFPELTLPASFPDLTSGYPDQPEFTHYIVGFNGTLDHILMTSNTPCGTLSFVRQAEMPTLEQVTLHQAMPSPHFPSDHVAIVSDLEWIPSSN